MIGPTGAVRVMVATKPVDFRKGAEGLAALVREAMTADPYFEAAECAAEFRFHPTQLMEREDDGSLIVRFHAAGWLEMAWHLYQWGDKVEVVAPEGLRALIAGHRRPDFDALP
jgi:predicted DNA-binding transcriptional regulator YafY